MKRESQTITFRVYSDTDALIQQTLINMTEGERSDFIRETLREKITGQLMAEPTPETSPLDQIMRQLADIQNRLNQGVPMLGATMPSAAPETEIGGLNEEEAARRARKLSRQDW